MYTIGDLVIYGKTGVCRVRDVALRADSRGEKRQYYILTPLYESCEISIPVGSKKMYLRPIISREQALELIDAIPQLRQKADHSRVLRELESHYAASLDTHDCEDLVRLTSSIYEKREEALLHNRRLGAVDERFLRKGEALLFGELAAALDIPVEDVPALIASRLEEPEQPVG